MSREYDNLIKSINRKPNRRAEIKVENTEDEGDLATISHGQRPALQLARRRFRTIEIYPGSHEGAGDPLLRVGLDRFVRVLILESRAPINNQYVVFTDETSGHCSSDIVGVVPTGFQFVF